MIQNIHSSWSPILKYLYQPPLQNFKEEVLNEISYCPEFKNIYRVFTMPVQDIKVVFLGVEPESVPYLSNGYAYARHEQYPLSRTLRNIEREIYTTKEIKVLNQENDLVTQDWKTLSHWKEQGVFLLNASLTVETGKSGSHLKYWDYFIKQVIQFISNVNPCVWVFWEQETKTFINFIKNPFYVPDHKETINSIPINSDWNYVIQGESPKTAKKFEGSGDHFYFINTILKKTKSMQIVW